VLRTYFLLATTLVFPWSTSSGQNHSAAVATIDVSRAIFESAESKQELAAIHTKKPQERKQKADQIFRDLLAKNAPLIVKFAQANGLAVVIETSAQTPKDPILWTRRPDVNTLRKQVDITQQVVDSLDGASIQLPPIAGDQSVIFVNIQQAIFNTDDGKRELAAIGSNVTPEQKQTLSQTILTKMNPFIARVAGDNGADIVIDASAQWPQSSVLWFDPRLDVTEQVVRAYNGR